MKIWLVIKKWFISNKEAISEILTVLVSILLLAGGLFVASKYFFPEWNDTPRGNTRLLASIALGILTYFKSIIEVIEKWFFKKDKYILSENLKIIIEWLVNKVEEGKIKQEFEFKYSASNEVSSKILDNLDQDDKIIITKGDMMLLENLGFIIIKPKPQFNLFYCVIDVEKASQAIKTKYKN